MRIRFFSASVLLLAASFQAGCETVPPSDGARQGPFFTPTNTRGVERLPAAIRRVALLPAAGGPGVVEESLIRMDEALLAEFTRTARAECVPVSRELLARIAGVRQIDSAAALPHDLLSRIKSSTQADAVVFVDITSYSPYPPLAIGLRAKLVNVESSDILWAFDAIFDSAKPAVRNSARRHALAEGNTFTMTADMSATILQNPSRFAAYVGAATFATLPPR
ncbi:MAG: hypothetical protein U1F61_20320 [Opitutaceae bacterium]